MQKHVSLDLGGLVLVPEGASNASLGNLVLVVPGEQLRPHVSVVVLLEDVRLREVQTLDLGGINHVEDRKLFVDGHSLNLPSLSFAVNPEGAENIFGIAEIVAVLDAHHHSVDDLTITLLFGEILPADFGPVDRGPVEDLESKRVVDFNLVGDIWAFDDGRVVPES